MVSVAEIKGVGLLDDIGHRLSAASEIAEGNIIEIGGGDGVNTLRFLRVAARLGKKVVVVDPFSLIEGADESYFSPYSLETFLRTTAEYGKYLHLIQRPSQDPRAWLEMGAFAPVGFMFIDGLQDKASVVTDLRTAELLEAEIICVDDYNRLTDSSQVPLAVADFLNTTKYRFIDIGKREAYFIK